MPDALGKRDLAWLTCVEGLPEDRKLHVWARLHHGSLRDIEFHDKALAAEESLLAAFSSDPNVNGGKPAGGCCTIS